MEINNNDIKLGKQSHVGQKIINTAKHSNDLKIFNEIFLENASEIQEYLNHATKYKNSGQIFLKINHLI